MPDIRIHIDRIAVHLSARSPEDGQSIATGLAARLPTQMARHLEGLTAVGGDLDGLRVRIPADMARDSGAVADAVATQLALQVARRLRSGRRG